jgi:hypothetical protein
MSFFGENESVNFIFWREARNLFSLLQNQNIFQQHWESDYFLGKKNIPPPLLEVNWSVPKDKKSKGYQNSFKLFTKNFIWCRC